jgi:hypothetical protein
LEKTAKTIPCDGCGRACAADPHAGKLSLDDLEKHEVEKARRARGDE